MIRLNCDRAKTHALRYGTTGNCEHLLTLANIARAKNGVVLESGHLKCLDCVPEEELIEVA